MSAETSPQTSGSPSVIETVLGDKKVQKSLQKIGKRTLLAAGVTRKTTFTRRTKLEPKGALEAWQDPRKVLLSAAEQTGKELPRLTFRIGRAAVRAVFNNANERASKPQPQRPEAASTLVGNSSTAKQGEDFSFNPEPLDTVGVSANKEYSPAPIAADSTAGTKPEQVSFNSPLTNKAEAPVVINPLEQAELPYTNPTAGATARPIVPVTR